MKRLLSTTLTALLIGATAAITVTPAAFADIIIVSPRRGRSLRHFDSRFDRRFDSRFNRHFDSRFDGRGLSRRQFVRSRFRHDPYLYNPRGRVFIRGGSFRRHRPFRRHGRVFRRY
ncbi:MAG: hypothetical protein AAFY11_07000 [Cyanobacteria bacterium J06641_5]